MMPSLWRNLKGEAILKSARVDRECADNLIPMELALKITTKITVGMSYLLRVRNYNQDFVTRLLNQEIFHLRCYRHELVMSCYHGENIARALPGLELCYSMTRRFLDKQTTVVGQV
ncbi:hypothetical protein ACQJBY_024966 [Aegilops geniculata]